MNVSRSVSLDLTTWQEIEKYQIAKGLVEVSETIQKLILIALEIEKSKNSEAI